MSFRLPKPANLPDLLRRYEAGETAHKLASECGIGPNTFARWLREANVSVRRSALTTAKRIPANQSIIDRYVAGETEQSLALEIGISRQTIRRWLTEAKISIRGISDTMLVRWNRASDQDRAAMVAAAHNAVRGSRVSMERQIRSAATRETTQRGIGGGERWMADALRSRGIAFTPQKAVGPYNLDIGIHSPTVAVEIFGGGWHNTGYHAARHPDRVKYLLDQGWAVLIIWVDNRSYPLGVGAVEATIAFADFLRRQPTPLRQYRVILGDGQLAPVRKSYLNTPALIAGL